MSTDLVQYCRARIQPIPKPDQVYAEATGLEALAFAGAARLAIAFFAGFGLAFYALAFFLDLVLLAAPGFKQEPETSSPT
jgi:hypothetical protein